MWLQQITLDFNSYVSLAVLVAIIGGTATLVAKFTTLSIAVDSLKQGQEEAIKEARKLRTALGHVEDHMMLQEDDMNNLFAVLRGWPAGEDVLRITRKPRFIPFRD